MNQNLSASSWHDTMEKIRKCHISLIQETTANVKEWKEAFDALISSIKEERINYPEFAQELSDLTDSTGSSYAFNDILEEYFDYLEENKAWEIIIESSDTLINLFKWEAKYPSEYMFRKGDSLLKLDKLQEAKTFGEIWLKEYPNDLYAVASNVFLLITMGESEKALELTDKHLTRELKCNKTSDTFLMAAYRLYEITSDINAKQRIEAKIAAYNEMSENQ